MYRVLLVEYLVISSKWLKVGKVLQFWGFKENTTPDGSSKLTCRRNEYLVKVKQCKCQRVWDILPSSSSFLANLYPLHDILPDAFTRFWDLMSFDHFKDFYIICAFDTNRTGLDYFIIWEEA